MTDTERAICSFGTKVQHTNEIIYIQPTKLYREIAATFKRNVCNNKKIVMLLKNNVGNFH